MSAKNTTADLFGEALGDLASGPMVGAGAQLTRALLTRLSEKGMTLEQCAGPRVMARSVRTLQTHARKYQIAMPDYVPMSMRPRLVFMQRGDFFELIGEHVEAAARVLGVVVQTSKAHGPTFGIPAHSIDDAREKLRAAWFVVKLVKQKKARGKKNG